MKYLYLSCFLCLISLRLSAENYYWIGGTGDWSDPTHWSLSDLGTGEPAEAIPTINDNVYFNEFSFTNDGDTVYISQPNTYCKELDWGNIEHRAVLYFRPDADDDKRIHVGGSLLLSPTLEILGDEVTWVFKAASFNNLLVTSGKTLDHAEFNSEAGEWWLFDQFKVSGTVRHLAGRLNTNTHNIFCTDFESSGSTPRKLMLSTSTLEARNALILENNNLDLELGTSNLTCSVLKAPGFALNDVTLLLGQTAPRIEGSDITINNLDFGGPDALSILSNTMPDMPLEFVLPAGETLTVLGDVLVNSLCTNPVSLVSSQPGTQAYLTARNNAVEVSYIRIKDVAVSGNNFVAYNSSDGGNNSGWIFVGEPGPCNLTVELSDFTAECQNRNVILYWTTETEINSAYFGVEVSSDGRNFEEIAKISAAGNSTELLDYTFVDPELRTGQHYYRLNQIDAFNEAEHSEILNVSCLPPPPDDIIDIYPNPIGDAAVLHLNMPATNNVRVEVYNSFGQLLINETRIAPQGIHDLDISMFYMLPGVYIVKVYIDGRYMKKKFVKR